MAYFMESNNTHIQIQWVTQIYFLSLFSVVMLFLLIQKHRQPALIAAVSCLLVHGGLSVFYAYALTGDQHVHKWLRQPENKFKNDVICTICHLGYGIGYYILLVRPWMMSVQLPYILGDGAQKKIKLQDDTDGVNANELDDDMLSSSFETRKTKQLKLQRAYTWQKYLFGAFHIVMCSGILYLAWFCSHRRNQAVSFYLTIAIFAGWLCLDTARRTTCALWNHPQMKHSYLFTYIQVGFWWSIAALIWISIHPYALNLAAAMEHKLNMTYLMKCVADFYNVISATEARGAFIDTFMAIQVVWTQIKYTQISKDFSLGIESELILAQKSEISELKNVTSEEKHQRLALVNLKYQVGFESLGQRAFLLTHALSFFHLRRPYKNLFSTIKQLCSRGRGVENGPCENDQYDQVLVQFTNESFIKDGLVNRSAQYSSVGGSTAVSSSIKGSTAVTDPARDSVLSHFSRPSFT